jgi:DNA-directed RNA polymerase specialized sigma24 family protein
VILAKQIRLTNKDENMEHIILEKEILAEKSDFVKLYKEVFPKVAKYVAGKGGTLNEAKDIFQDALIIYYEKKNSQQEFLDNGHYILGIAKNLWINKFREESRSVSLEESKTDIPFKEEKEPDLNTGRLMEILERSGRKCLDLLQSFYYQKLPLSEIATRFGFAGVRSATVQKYKCIEKVRETVKEKSLSYEDFLN